MRSLRPARMPDDDGPQMFFPPLKLTRSAPSSRVARQPRQRRQFAGGIHQDRDAGFLAERDQLVRLHHLGLRIALDARDHADHRRAIGDGVYELFSGFDLDDRHARRAEGAVVGHAVRLLHQALPLGPGHLRQRLDLLAIGAGKDRRGAEHHRPVRAGRDHRGLGLHDCGDPRAGGAIELLHIDEEILRFAHRVDDLGRHHRVAVARQRLERADHRPDAEHAGIDVVRVGGFRDLRGGRACHGVEAERRRHGSQCAETE